MPQVEQAENVAGDLSGRRRLSVVLDRVGPRSPAPGLARVAHEPQRLLLRTGAVPVTCIARSARSGPSQRPQAHRPAGNIPEVRATDSVARQTNHNRSNDESGADRSLGKPTLIAAEEGTQRAMRRGGVGRYRDHDPPVRRPGMSSSAPRLDQAAPARVSDEVGAAGELELLLDMRATGLHRGQRQVKLPGRSRCWWVRARSAEAHRHPGQIGHPAARAVAQTLTEH